MRSAQNRANALCTEPRECAMQAIGQDTGMNTSPAAPYTHILLVDDDTKLHISMQEYLTFLGWKLTVRRDGANIETVLREVMPDLVLLDVALHNNDNGFDVLQRLRTGSHVPVIMLTGRISDADRIAGLRLGADDYLAKPFNPRELVARIKAILRRRRAQPGLESGKAGVLQGVEEPEEMRELAAGGFHLDRKRRKISHGSASADLGGTEFHIIQAFMKKPGEVLSRDAMQTLAFGESYHGTDRNIDVYVSRARNILRTICAHDPIETVWGSGYRWKEDS